MKLHRRKSFGFSILEVMIIILITGIIAVVVSRSFLSTRLQLVDTKFREQMNDMIESTVNYGDVCMSIVRAVDIAVTAGNITGVTVTYPTNENESAHLSRALSTSEAYLLGDNIGMGNALVVRTSQIPQGTPLTFQDNADIRLKLVTESQPYFTIVYKIANKLRNTDSTQYGDHLNQFGSTQKFAQNFLQAAGGDGSCTGSSSKITPKPAPTFSP